MDTLKIRFCGIYGDDDTTVSLRQGTAVIATQTPILLFKTKPALFKKDSLDHQLHRFFFNYILSARIWQYNLLRYYEEIYILWISKLY